MATLLSHRWEPITELPDHWKSFARPDLDAARDAWDAERRALDDPARVELVVERLSMRWAIETGLIERLYNVDRGTTESIVAAGIEALETFADHGVGPAARALIADQRTTLDYLQELKREEALTVFHVRELHQLLCRRQQWVDVITPDGQPFRSELIKGDWKRWPNNPRTSDGATHEYCPPEHVQSEIETLIRLHGMHRAAGVRPEVEAAWLHHRFAQIHPFQDGNGRVARALATLEFLRAGFLPLVIRDQEHRELYLNALEGADGGDLAPFVSLFANVEEADLDSAISDARAVREGGIRAVAIAAAAAANRGLGGADAEVLNATTAALEEAAFRRLQSASNVLAEAFHDVGIELYGDVDRAGFGGLHYWRAQIAACANIYGYSPAFNQSRTWAALTLSLNRLKVGYVVVSFHHKRVRPPVMAAVVFLTNDHYESESGEVAAFGTPAEFSYAGALADTSDFEAWLEAGLTSVLNEWQASL